MRNIKGTICYEFDTEDGEIFDLEIDYDYMPYSPPHLTADPYYSEPADGGGCEEIIYKVVGYRQYDENFITTLNMGKLTPEQSKEFTAKVEKLVDKSVQLQRYFNNLCVKDAEDSMARDYD